MGIEFLLVLLLILWLAGFLGNVGGNFVHILLIICLVVFLFRYLPGSWHGPGPHTH